MEDPVAEVGTIIHLLTQSPPSIQQSALSKYFTPSASFTHPFCRTGSYDLGAYLPSTSFPGWLFRENGPLPLLSSRGLTAGIYRWYKVLSPEIELGIDSVAFDAKHLVLYVSLHQTFRIARLPFIAAPVNLVTVLELEQVQGPGETLPRAETTQAQKEQPAKYLIKSQNDRYQIDEWLKFISVFRIAWTVVILLSFAATVACVAGQAICWPIVGLEERWGARKAHQRAEMIEHGDAGDTGRKGDGSANGHSKQA